MTQTQTKYRNKLRPTKRATTDFKKWIGFTHKMLDLADLVAVRLSYVFKIFWHFVAKKMTTKCHILVIYLVCSILHWSPLDGSGVDEIIWHFRAKNDYKVSYPGISPGMIKPPLEPTRWLWSSPRLKQAVIQKRCSCCLPHNKIAM